MRRGLLTALALSLAASCVARHAPVRPAPDARTFVFVCEDGPDLVARIDGDAAWVFLPTGTRQLPHVVSASGARFSDDRVTLWTKGQEARLTDDAGIVRRCRNDPRRAVWEHAKLDGVDFRAIGQEPGWTLEIRHGATMLLVSDYGTARHEFPTPEPAVDPEARTTRYDAGPLTVLLSGTPCQDTMSGEPFPVSVEVLLDGRTFRGCGRPLH